MNTHTLQNYDNYYDTYTHNIHEIFIKYVAIINEYISQFTENIKIKNISYYIYVLNKGIETLCHVFKTILLYSKNLKITYIQCQKAVYYYIEFMCQIGETSHSFLQLNSKDATLFVYKKTIFEINNEIIKEFTAIIGTCSILTNIEGLTDIYNKAIIHITNNSLTNKSITNNNIINKTLLLKEILCNTTELSKYLLNLHIDCTEEMYENKVKTVELFSHIMYSLKQYSTKLMVEFSKQLSKPNINIKFITRRINSITYLDETEYKKAINYLITGK